MALLEDMSSSSTNAVTVIVPSDKLPYVSVPDTSALPFMSIVVAAIDADLFLRYDYEDKDAPRPAAYPLDSEDVVAIYGTSVYGTPTYGGASQPLVRQAVEGSGFAVAVRVKDGTGSAPYSLKGFQLEYQLGARR